MFKIKKLKLLITDKNYKSIYGYLLLNKDNNIYKYTRIYKYIIESDDKKILYIFKKMYNISWNIIIYKLMKYNKYNMINNIIIENKLIMNVKLLNERQFIEFIINDVKINFELIDHIIRNNLQDKIKIYCDYGIVTDELIKIVLDKYYSYNIVHFINKIYILSTEFIEKIIKCKKIEYIDLIIDKCNSQFINNILEYSLIDDYQAGIDYILKRNTNYLIVLDKIMKK